MFLTILITFFNFVWVKRPEWPSLIYSCRQLSNKLSQIADGQGKVHTFISHWPTSPFDEDTTSLVMHWALPSLMCPPIIVSGSCPPWGFVSHGQVEEHVWSGPSSPINFLQFPQPTYPKCLHDRLYNMGRNLRKDFEHSAMESSLCWFRVVSITSSGWGTLFELLPKLVLVLVERIHSFSRSKLILVSLSSSSSSLLLLTLHYKFFLVL